MEHLVQHAVTTIREHYAEPLSLDELARGAMVSKFHFLRLFTRVTGVTPGRFLSAVRLQEAKRLLLSTSLTVADVAVGVGYSSTGSFTRRFTESVGLSPTQYRRLSLTSRDETPEPAADEMVDNGAGKAAHETSRTGSVTGLLRTVGAAPRPVYVGAFDSPIVQGTPVSWSNSTTQGRFALARVPEGTWYIHAVAHGTRPDSAADVDPALLMATVGPVRVHGDTAHRLDITLSLPDWTRPPVLSALPGLDPQPIAA